MADAAIARAPAGRVRPGQPVPVSYPSLPALLFQQARQRADRPMLRYWRDGAWQRLRWAAFAHGAAAVAAWLRAQGVMPGDRVLIVSESRPEFPIADTAIMAIGAVTVPTYTTNTVADHAHILRDSGARVAVVSTPALARKVAEAAAQAEGLDLLLGMDPPPGLPGIRTHGWAEAVATPCDGAALEQETHRIAPGQLACLVYTSGTGGAPRGVMLPHRAMLANREGVARITEQLHLEGEAYLSFLPLSHAYEHTVGFLLPTLGVEVVYSRGADRLASEFREIRPAIVTAVPRVFELLRGRLLAQREKLSPIRRTLFDRAVTLGLRRMDGPKLGPLARIEDAVLDRLVRRAVRERFGGRLVAMVSGGARLDPDLAGFFLALGLPVLQGYGQTEAGPVVSVNPPWDIRRETVGPPLEGVTVRIAPDGELLLRGDLVMDGYWGQPGATAAALRPSEDDPDGPVWLHTGDVGTIEDGYIRITDRKRDIIKTLGGDMVSPARLEGLLMAEPEIAQAVVAGDGQAGISALLVPAEDMAEKVEATVQRVNRRLSGIERIRHWAVVPPFTLEEGLLTPTQKVKRRAVLAHHAATLEALRR
ncbi:long-chain fatty acid--CoA ligase [Roseomonas sp. NAR14]|uniref:Long-chain fatty acid--CoA ligase n=1 Tax=Roseomonas acroporae TaxID=2937791 RepID=A0A9X2BW45_9PROT|nr:long-chain fatty acid--CoA ligase [Roseomonas acroporae]MCK8783465.1 long-chain fatty acid--CoA ligase [Roseomonas acroporae]